MSVMQSLRSALALRGLLCERFGSRLDLPCAFLLSPGVVAAALGLRLWLAPWLAGAQFITFFPAVILATLLGGTIAGLVAVALAAVAAAQFLIVGSLTLQEANSLGLFVVVAAMDVAIISALLAANAALRRSVTEVGRLNDSLRASEARFRDLLEITPDAIVIADRDERIVLVNAESERQFGYARSELLGQPLTLLMPERFRDLHKGRVEAFLHSSGTRRMGYGQQLFARRKDGSEFPIETNLGVLPGDGHGLVSSAIRDVTLRLEGEERQTLLINELNHRVKNTLASVQAIISQTLKTASDPRTLGEALTARLLALSKSHDVLTRRDWSGAPLRDIIAEQLQPYEKDGAPRFRLDGPEVSLTPNRSITLGMALGELATNAAKYGALSMDTGAVDVSWRRCEEAGVDRLKVVWLERGGPAVSQPSRRGFGAQLIERSLSRGLEGHATLEFRPDGLRCEMDFPLQPGEA